MCCQLSGYIRSDLRRIGSIAVRCPASSTTTITINGTATSPGISGYRRTGTRRRLHTTPAESSVSGTSHGLNLTQILMPTPNIYIDGSAGTTGLKIKEQLSNRDDIKLFVLPYDDRRDREKDAPLSQKPTSSSSACPTTRQSKPPHGQNMKAQK